MVLCVHLTPRSVPYIVNFGTACNFTEDELQGNFETEDTDLVYQLVPLSSRRVFPSSCDPVLEFSIQHLHLGVKVVVVARA